MTDSGSLWLLDARPTVHSVAALTVIEAEIIDGYMPPFPGEHTKPTVVIRCGEWFLRYSKGPETGSFWDAYGEDFQTVDLARRELAKAPPVPSGKPYVTYSFPLPTQEASGV